METIVNVATSMPFVLVGLQTPRLAILYCYSGAETKKLILHLKLFFHDLSTDILLFCIAGKSLQVECMEILLLEWESRQACITHLVEI